MRNKWLAIPIGLYTYTRLYIYTGSHDAYDLDFRSIVRPASALLLFPTQSFLFLLHSSRHALGCRYGAVFDLRINLLSLGELPRSGEHSSEKRDFLYLLYARTHIGLFFTCRQRDKNKTHIKYNIPVELF